MKTLLSVLAVAGAFAVNAVAAPLPVANEVCPVCGKTAKLVYHSDVKGQRVIFASGACKDKFDKAPGRYRVTQVKK